MTVLEDAPRAAHAASERTPALRHGLLIDGVRRGWSGREVLSGIDLQLAPGTATWLGGENGAGKTTLLRIVAGILVPDAGTVLIDELSPRRTRRQYQACIGLLSAGDRAMYARLTVRDHMEMWSRFAMLPRRERRPAIDRAVARFELGELEHRRLDRMSMGQRQRVRLAMTFLHDPAVVLLDEPQTSLDSPGAELLAAAVDDLRARGGAALWCTPEAAGIEPDFDARWLLRDGQLVRA